MDELKIDEANASQKAKNKNEETEKDFTLSDSSRINTKGFRVDLAGGRYERFDANPVMLYDHDTKLLIGRWENRRIENGVMKAKPIFNLKNSFAAEKAQEVKDEFLRGASIGLIPYQMDKIGDEYILTDWELLEASITPIPSDAGAVRLYNDKREVITFEQLKLGFSNNNNKISKKMEANEAIVLTAITRQSLGLSANPTAKEIELAVAEKDKTIADQAKKIEILRESEIDTYLSQAVKDGKITQDDVPDQRELALLNFSKVKAVIDRKLSQNSVSLKDMAKKTHLSDGDRASWTLKDWAQKDSKGLEKLKAGNPTEFERLKTNYSQSNKIL